MSFSAQIDDSENKSIWFRCIVALASISDKIQFIISESKVTLTAINVAHVSHGEVTFNRLFFKSYKFNSDSISGEGLEKDEDGEITYSFSVRSKILSILFRKTEDDIESYKLAFNASEKCSVNERFRLQVEIKTKSMIRKQYNPFYQPCKVDKLGVSKKYKEALLDTNKNNDSMEVDGEDGEINYMMINNSILKGFLENVSSTTEDFKLEVNQKNFSITAFTKGIFVKEKEILKQPMAVNIVFNTDELLDLRLFDGDDKKIVYRLKDFKTFLNLGANNDFIEVWFKKPGDPVLFELSKNECCIQFVQVTDGENTHHLEARHTKVIPREKVGKKRKQNPKKGVAEFKNQVYDHTMEMDNEFNEPLFVPDEDEDENEVTVADKSDQTIKPPPRLPNVPTSIFQVQENEDDDDDGEEKDEEDLVTDENRRNDLISWGEPNSKDQKISQLINNSKTDERRLISEAKTKYLNEIKKRKLANVSNTSINNNEENELGPTQNISKVKGIFD